MWLSMWDRGASLCILEIEVVARGEGAIFCIQKFYEIFEDNYLIKKLR